MFDKQAILKVLQENNEWHIKNNRKAYRTIDEVTDEHLLVSLNSHFFMRITMEDLKSFTEDEMLILKQHATYDHFNFCKCDVDLNDIMQKAFYLSIPNNDFKKRFVEDFIYEYTLANCVFNNQMFKITRKYTDKLRSYMSEEIAIKFRREMLRFMEIMKADRLKNELEKKIENKLKNFLNDNTSNDEIDLELVTSMGLVAATNSKEENI